MNLQSKLKQYKKRQFCDYIKSKYNHTSLIIDICEGILNTDKGYIEQEEGRCYIPVISEEGKFNWYIVTNKQLNINTRLNKDLCDFFKIEYEKTVV